MNPVRRRPNVRAAVILLPSGFTLANLFLGIWAIVEATRGEFDRAGLFIVLGGVADLLDGRVARATGTGSRFGEELDSLVDAISFGVAPAMIMYVAVLEHDGWDWIFAFIFVACVVLRLARFNVEQAGRPKKAFNGLPSPAAGLTLATYYWFSQTNLYPETFIGLPWQQTMRWLMFGLGALMISSVQYPPAPTIGLRSWRGIMGTILVAGTLIGVIVFPWSFFFPALLTYVAYGLVKTVFVGLLDRLPPGHGRHTDDLEEDAREHLADDAEHEQVEHTDTVDVPYSAPPTLLPGKRRRRRRRHGGTDRHGPDSPTTGPEGDVA